MNDAVSKLYFELRRRLEREMEEAFGRLWRRYVGPPALGNYIEIPSLSLTATGSPQYWRPATDIFETEDEFVLRLEIAGLNPDSVRIYQSGDGRKLGLQGERKDEAKDARTRHWYHQLEIYFGPFELSIVLPVRLQLDLEDVKASYQDGILILKISKKKESDEKKRERTLSIPIE
jgi:HSP20 family molecular chaperone IbpA